MEKLFLSQLINKYHVMDMVEQEQVNLIHAYAGSGKTTYILQMIEQAQENIFGENDNQFIYVCDTKLLKQQFKNEYVARKSKLNGTNTEQLYKIGQHGNYIPMSCHIMTYYGWLYYMKNAKQSWLEQKTFIFDECHVLAQNCYNEKYLDYDEEEICDYLDLILDNGSTVLALSATPKKFNGLIIDNGFIVNDLLKGHKDELRQYTSQKVIKYNEKPQELLSHIPFTKVLIYWCGSKDEMHKTSEIINKMGYTSCCIHAEDKKCPNLEGEAVKDYIIKNNNIPQNYDVIIFNKSMGTGINIIDENHEIDTFITYATKHEYLDDDDIHQARMRIRRDIECEYRYTKAHDIKKVDKDDIKLLEVIEEYIDKDLKGKNIKEITKTMKWINEQRNTLSVDETIVKLQSLGYTVELKVIRKVKHYMIKK